MNKMRAQIAIEGKNLSKSYEDRQVLEAVNLHVTEGEIVSVLGISGSGKTTLFNLLAGLDTADTGSVYHKHDIGYMLQKDLLMPWKTIGENVALPLILKGRGKREALEEVGPYFKDFGLEGYLNSYPRALSGGMRQRAALLRTFLISGKIMLLDEPFSGLDAITRHNLHCWLHGLIKKMGLTVLLITHDIEEALSLSDRIYILSGLPASVKDEIRPVDKDSARQKILRTLGEDIKNY